MCCKAPDQGGLTRAALSAPVASIYYPQGSEHSSSTHTVRVSHTVVMRKVERWERRLKIDLFLLFLLIRNEVTEIKNPKVLIK